MGSSPGRTDSDAKEKGKEQCPADFETAISAAGFGMYNVRLLFVSLIGIMGTVFETATVSYVLPSAECDLHLTLLDKGILNAITYLGMVIAAIPWGYFADTKGRRLVTVVGLLAGGLCDLSCSTSQSVIQLMILKFLGGAIMCGPFVVLTAYMAEMHGKRYRARILMIMGFMFATSAITLPLIAVAILPSGLNFKMGSFFFHTWQVFLACSAIPALLGGFLLIFFPESPKFLMSQGRNAEALEAFKTIYSVNKGKPKDTYPITELMSETTAQKHKSEINTLSESIHSKDQKDISKIKHSVSFRSGLLQLKPLFQKQYLGLSILVYSVNSMLLMGQNTMRLWLPQLFASFNEFQAISDSVPSMCNIVEFGVNKTASVVSAADNLTKCVVIITPSTYMNNLIVGSTNLLGYVIVSIVVNRIGTKRILLIALFISGTCGLSLYWSTSSVTTLITTALYTTFGSISSTSLISSSINSFPTSLRSMVVSLTMMFGRGGSVIGNVLFPVFMSLGCIYPFLLVSAVMYMAFILSTFLPNTSKAALK